MSENGARKKEANAETTTTMTTRGGASPPTPPFVQNGTSGDCNDKRFAVPMMSSEKDFVCFDATCYHRGAPLLHADIGCRTPCDAKDDEKKKSCALSPVAPL